MIVTVPVISDVRQVVPVIPEPFPMKAAKAGARIAVAAVVVAAIDYRR